MRLGHVCLLLAFGCGSKASGGDDVAPTDGPPVDTDPCANVGCPSDTGLFVSMLKGADTNPGTKAMPFKTIGAALAAAKALGGPQLVYVAQGNYQEKVTLAEGIDLNGGYECNATACSWTRDLVMFESTITNQDYEGVLAGAGITSATLVAGFRIVGKDGVPPTAPGSSGVTLLAAWPTVRGNKIVGGTVTGGGAPQADRSIGIAMRGTGGNPAQIENNDITSGSAISLSSAITMENVSGATSYANITANVLRSGTARRSVVIAAYGGGPGTVIANNDLTAGNSNGGASNGIEATSTLAISGNRINTDATSVGMCTNQTNYCSGITSFGATLWITNNVVYGPKAFRTASVFLSETEIPAGDVILNGNYLNGGGQGGPVSGVQRSESSAVAVTIGQCNTCGLKGVIGRVRNNILDGGINLNRYGVREDPPPGKTTRVELLQANDIWFAANLNGRSDTLYRQVTAGGTAIDTKSVVILNQMTVPACTLNQNADPLIDATWHLMAGSPCAQAGVATEAPQVDFDGQGRPSAGLYDIGPDEM